MSWLVRFYKAVVVVSLSLYALAMLTGWRMGDPERDRVDPSVRSSPGGYRSFHFWHTGYAGGK
jgi:hypothetical protein